MGEWVSGIKGIMTLSAWPSLSGFLAICQLTNFPGSLPRWESSQEHLAQGSCGTHLTGVQPILQLRFVFDSWQQQSVHYVFTDGCQDGETEANAEEHEESREMLDAHLQSLG